MTTPAQLTLPPIYIGVTYSAPLERATVPYAVREECGRLVKACSGEPVPDSDITDEDYTGCSAMAEFLRDGDPEAVLLLLSSAAGGIELDGKTLRLKMTADETGALPYGDTPPAWNQCLVRITVTRPSGEKEPQYELPVVLLPWRRDP